jgi:four helix bundle protein
VAEYRKLDVWVRAHHLTLDVYQATRSFPREEAYGLTSQLRRAASSIPANIAEGCGRRGDAELARFVSIALGSATELDYHLLLARDLEYLQPQPYEHLASEAQGVARMLAAFIETLRRTNHRNPTANSQQPIANSQ